MSLIGMQESEKIQLSAIRKMIALFNKQKKVVEQRLNEINALTAFDKAALIKMRNGAISGTQKNNVEQALTELEQAYLNSDPVRGVKLRERELAKFSRERTELQAYKRELEIRMQTLQKQVNDVSVNALQQIRSNTILRESYAQARETGAISVPRVRKLLRETIVNIASRPDSTNAVFKNVSIGTWTRQLVDKFSSNVTDAFITGITRGDDYKTISQSLSKATGMSQRTAAMFIRTEGNSVMNESTRKVITSNDLVKGYIFVSRLDNRTSHPCQEMDGKYIPKEDVQPGVNYPPLHFNCRSHVKIVKVDEDEKDVIVKRYAKVGNKMTPIMPNTTYKEWKANFSTHDRPSLAAGINQPRPKQIAPTFDTNAWDTKTPEQKKAFVVEAATPYDSMEPKVAAAFADYTGAMSSDINKAAVGMVDGFQRADKNRIYLDARTMKNHIAREEILTENITTYHDANYSGPLSQLGKKIVSGDVQVGDLITDLPFISSRYTKPTADEIGVDNLLVEIRIPKGQGRGIFIPNSPENEYLIQANTQFQILQKLNDRHIIMEAVYKE